MAERSMKTALAVSLLANVVLAAMLWHLAPLPRRETFAPAAAPTEAPRLRPDSSSTPFVGGLGTAQHFDWRQIEAPNYPTYVANLRAIHCPEQTLRDIITADVACLFARQRKVLAPNIAATGFGPWSQAEEARLVASLLGESRRSQPGGAPSPEGDSSHPRDDSTTRLTEPVRMPLVFQTRALARLKLNAEQSTELRELAQQFVQEIGGANQDPSDPAYLARWQQAQPKFDGLIVNVIGRRALVDLDEAMPAPEGGKE